VVKSPDHLVGAAIIDSAFLRGGPKQGRQMVRELLAGGASPRRLRASFSAVALASAALA
jgi:hypothetical protein